ncbi:hypothetical protein NCAS_0D01440 [Naumovozyma castellii]|uniref:DDE-1 domain-containing protein n=1 Tax=Naumovozyma castellii TaxID=27288 RepID=G0VDT6_NAUCA|nr:hypothetical protein NCAS_0D01440 [Naumovozyma castellii CBS 4309]CCC69725.1 hypothetical protein NCAS_0D01440 [Naumovozyma castellii CBS 4309]
MDTIEIENVAPELVEYKESDYTLQVIPGFFQNQEVYIRDPLLMIHNRAQLNYLELSKNKTMNVKTRVQWKKKIQEMAKDFYQINQRLLPNTAKKPSLSAVANYFNMSRRTLNRHVKTVLPLVTPPKNGGMSLDGDALTISENSLLVIPGHFRNQPVYIPDPKMVYDEVSLNYSEVNKDKSLLSSEQLELKKNIIEMATTFWKVNQDLLPTNSKKPTISAVAKYFHIPRQTFDDHIKGFHRNSAIFGASSRPLLDNNELQLIKANLKMASNNGCPIPATEDDMKYRIERILEKKRRGLKEIEMVNELIDKWKEADKDSIQGENYKVYDSLEQLKRILISGISIQSLNFNPIEYLKLKRTFEHLNSIRSTYQNNLSGKPLNTVSKRTITRIRTKLGLSQQYINNNSTGDSNKRRLTKIGDIEKIEWLKSHVFFKEDFQKYGTNVWNCDILSFHIGNVGERFRSKQLREEFNKNVLTNDINEERTSSKETAGAKVEAKKIASEIASADPIVEEENTNTPIGPNLTAIDKLLLDEDVHNIAESHIEPSISDELSPELIELDGTNLDAQKLADNDESMTVAKETESAGINTENELGLEVENSNDEHENSPGPLMPDQLSLLYTISMNGEVLEPNVLLNGPKQNSEFGSIPSYLLHDWIITKGNEDRELNGMLLNYLEKCFHPQTVEILNSQGLNYNSTSRLLVLNSGIFEINDDIIRFLNDYNIDLLIIPMTSAGFLQPIDFGLYNILQSELRKTNRMWFNDHCLLPPGMTSMNNALRPGVMSMVQQLELLYGIHNRLPQRIVLFKEMIKQSFSRIIQFDENGNADRDKLAQFVDRCENAAKYTFMLNNDEEQSGNEEDDYSALNNDDKGKRNNKNKVRFHKVTFTDNGKEVNPSQDNTDYAVRLATIVKNNMSNNDGISPFLQNVDADALHRTED